MTSLTLMRGVPGSGKSTFSKVWTSEDPGSRIRVNRDDIRMMLFSSKTSLTFEQESTVTRIERKVVEDGLKNGKDVIVDAMHLRPKYITEWYSLARKMGLEDVAIVPLWISKGEALRRNSSRPPHDQVPDDLIHTLFEKFARKGKFIPVKDFRIWEEDKSSPKGLEIVPIDPKTYSAGLPRVVIVDVDGTVALNKGGRDWYDWGRVEEDSPNEAVISLVQAIQSLGIPTIFLSGRDSVCYDATFRWLSGNGMNVSHLYMRAEGDMRPDNIVKYELFNKHIRDKYNVWFVLDDRDQVVRLFRDLGLTVLQVAYGNF